MEVIVVIWVWLLCGVQAGFAQEVEAPVRPVGQTLTEDALVDHDLGFRLNRTTDGWLLLEEARAWEAISDAVGAIAASGGRWLYVITEPASGTDLDAYQAAMRVLYAEGNEEVLREERTEFQGLPAWRTAVTGFDQELLYKRETVSFLSQGWYYQVSVNKVVATVDEGVETADLLAAFELLDVAPRGRGVAPLADTATAQWDVRDGVYEDAAYGLRWAPDPAFRIAVGKELTLLDPAARVGLVHGSPDLNIVIIPERVGASETGLIVGLRYEQFWQDYDITEPLDPTTLRVGDQLVDFVGGNHTGTGQGQMWHGVVHQDDRVLQVQFWYSAHARDTGALKRAADALATLSFLDEDATSQVAARLVGERQDSSIGTQWSWRAGVLRHVGQDLTWTSQAPTWEVIAGIAAAERYGEAVAFAALDPSRGLGATVSVEAGQGPAKALLAARIARDFEDPGRQRFHKARFQDAKGVGTDRVSYDGELSYQWRYAAVDRGDGSVVLIEAWSIGSVAGIAAEAFDELVSGLAVTRDVPADGFDLHGFRSERVGFTQKTLPGMRCSDNTPAQLQAGGAMVMCVGKPDEAGMVLAVHGVPAGADPAQRVALVRAMLGENALTRFGRDWSETDTTLLGEPATLIVMDPPGLPVEMLVVVVDATIFTLMTVGLDASRAEHWRLGLALLP